LSYDIDEVVSIFRHCTCNKGLRSAVESGLGQVAGGSGGGLAGWSLAEVCGRRIDTDWNRSKV
jgi:hypothetical protein